MADTITAEDLLKTQPQSGVDVGSEIGKAIQKSISQRQGPSGGPAAPPLPEDAATQQARYQASQYAAQDQAQQPPAQTTGQAVQQSGVLQPHQPQQPEETSASGSPTPSSAQLQPPPEQAQPQDISAADLQGGESISAKDLGGDGSSEGLVNRTVQDYKTIEGITQAYAQKHISKEIAQGAIGQLQNQYESASPQEQQTMEQAEADAKKAEQPKEEKSTATPEFQTLSSLLEAGVPGVTASFPLSAAQNYLDDQHKKGLINDADYAEKTGLLKKAQFQLQTNPALTASIGLGATSQGQQGIIDAEKDVTGLIDKAVPGFLDLRPQQASTEVVLAKDNFLKDYQKLLASGPRTGGDPTAPELSSFKANPLQTTARLDQASQNYEAQVARLTPSQDQQNQVDQEMHRRGMIPYSPEYMAAHNMAPKPGASTGLPGLAMQGAVTAANLIPNPFEPAIDAGLGWLLEKGAIPLSGAGRVIGDAGVQTLKQTAKKTIGGISMGATIAGADILRNPSEFLQNLQDPTKRAQTLEVLAAELGIPVVGGAILGTGLWGAGRSAEFLANIMRSASPAVRLAMEAGTERALSTELPYRAGRGPVTQLLGRSLESYLGSAIKGAPFAAPDLAQGDVKKFVSDLNQFGIYGALLRAPKTLSDAIRGSNFDYLFSYRGEDPNATKAPPQTRYGNSYYERASGNYVNLDDYTAKAMKTLDPSRAATFTHTQDLIKPYADAHMLPDGMYEHIANDQGANPDSHGFVNRDPNTGRLQAFFKASSFDTSALHEMVGHVAYRVMGPQNQAGFNHLLSQVVDMDSLANTYANKANPGTGKVTMADLPDQAEVTPGNPQYDPNKAQWARDHGNLTKQRAFEEAGAETLQALYSGKTAEQWTKKPNLLRQFAYYIGAGAEGMGLPTTTPDVNGPLSVRKSVAAAKILEAYLHDLSVGNIPQSGATKNYFGGAGAPWAPGQGPAPLGAQPITFGGPKQPPGGGAPVISGTPQLGGGGGGGAAVRVPAAPGGFATAKPANVLAVRTPGQPQVPVAPTPSETGPEAIPEVAPQTQVDESVIKGLMKQGFSREQAQDFAARGTVSPIHGAPRAQLVTPPPPEEHPADTPETHAQVKALREQGVPAGEAQAAAANKEAKTLAQTGEEPAHMPAGKMSEGETLSRSIIVERMERETGENINLDDPRVTAALGKSGTQEPPQPAAKRAQLPAVAPLAQPKDQDTGTSRQMRATWFGRNPDGSIDRTDEGRMSMYDAHHGAWGADLLDSKLKGVALSRNFLVANGINPRQSPGSQGYRVRVTAPNGRSEVVDIVDIGPDNKVDMTYGLGKSLGLSDNSQLKVELLDHQGKTVALRDKARGGEPGAETPAYMPGSGGGGPTAPWTPNQGPAPTYSWSQAPAAPGGEETPRAPAAAYPTQADTEPENVPVSYPGGGYGRGGGEVQAADQASQAMQMAQYTGTFGGGFGYGQILPGLGPPEAPSYMPGRKIGGIRPESEEGLPVQSTLGEPNVKGFEQLTPHLSKNTLAATKQAQQLHAKLLSPDDARVKKQADNMFKGEHFVQGDPLHAHVLADTPVHERMALAAGQTAIANKQPMHMSYASAPPGAEKESPITRQSREINYDASSPQARLLAQTNARLAGHSIIPTALGISLARKKGDPNSGYIQGISTSVAAHNHFQINKALNEMGQESPYPELNSDKFHNDMAGYVQNLLAGHTGTGNHYQKGTEEFPANPNKSYVPYRLKQREADFLNAVINNQGARHSQALRELARKGGTLLTEEGETNPIRHAIDASHAGLRPGAGEPIHDPAIRGAAQDRWSKEILEPTIRTFHAGLIHSLHERHEDIPQEIRPTVPGYEELTKTLGRELGSERGRPDIAMAAAFMPAKKRPAPLSPQEHEELTANIRKQFLGGKMRTADYLERLGDVPEPGEEMGPAYMPMAGAKARGFAQAKKEGRTFETPLPGGGQRFEIDDRDMQFKPASKRGQEDLAANNALHERYLSDTRGPGIMPLSDAIRHPELFENYPILRNTKISMDPTISHYGHYEQPWLDEEGNPRGNHIVVRDPTDKETLAHEIQHAVQHYENFAGKGANSAEIAKKMTNDPTLRQELRKQWDEAASVQYLDEKDRADWTKKRIAKMAQAMYEAEPGEIEARTVGQRAGRARKPEAYERPFIETTPKQDILDEMGHAERNLRAAAVPPGIAYMPGGKGEFKESKPEDFIAARNKSKRPQFLSPLEPGDIQKHKLYMNEEGTAGAAVSPEGDIQNVFNNGGGKGAGQRALAHAIRNGGTHLDAYDPFLPRLYRQFGFKETGRMKFNRDYAPPNWNFEEDDDPDIAFMAHQGYPEGGEAAAIERATGPQEHWLPNEHSTQREDDWDQAKERSRASVHQGPGEAPGPETLGAGEEPRDQAGGAGGLHLGPPPAPGGIAYMVGGKGKKAKEPEPPRAISKATLDQLGPRPKDEEQGKAWDRFAARMDKQIPGAIPLRPARNKKGQLKLDGNDNPEFEKEGGGYHLANAPMLGKRAFGYDKKGTVNKAPEGTVDTIDPDDLTYLTPADRLRISHLDKNGAIDMYADALHKEYNRIEKDVPQALKAKDWYNDTEGYLKQHFPEPGHADLVANLLAATSPRTFVKTNYGFAMNAAHRYLRGDYDRHIKLYQKAYQLKQAGELINHVSGLTDPKTGENYAPTSDAKAMAAYIIHHDILPTHHDLDDPTKKGPQYGMHSDAVLRVLAGHWLDQLEGPKTRRYTGNLSGRDIQSTGDMWVARELRRLAFEGHTKEPWLVQPPAESGLSDLDFAIQELAHRRASAKQALEPRQNQAIHWTSEILHWLKNGWATGVDPAERDYRPMLKEYQRPEWAKRASEEEQEPQARAA